jgi:hypothetical protein
VALEALERSLVAIFAVLPLCVGRFDQHEPPPLRILMLPAAW